MVSLDQVLLLEQKVESAVKKIAQLRAENDALRSKCAELTNALSSKSELLSTFEQDQNRIEDGIRNAIDRLNSIENAVLNAGASAATEQSAPPAEAAQDSVPAVQAEPVPPVHPQQEAPAVFPEPSVPQPERQPDSDSALPQPDASVQFSAMQEVPQAGSDGAVQDAPPQAPGIPPEAAPQNLEPENGQFDIF